MQHFRVAFFCLAVSCSPPPAQTEPAATPPEPSDEPAPRDTAPPDTDTPGTDHIEFSGTFSVTTQDKVTCTGAADAILVANVNIVGNATCEWEDGSVSYATLSGNLREEGDASGTIALDNNSGPWSGIANKTTLKANLSLIHI